MGPFLDREHRMTSQRLVVCLLLAGCSKAGPEDQVMRTMEARPALAIVAVDSVSGAGLAQTALAVVTEGAFTDTLRGADSVLSGVHERAGTYRVSVSAPGYTDWTVEASP